MWRKRQGRRACPALNLPFSFRCVDPTMTIEIKILQSANAQLLDHLPPGLFDKRINPALAAEFLGDPRHHLVVAIDASEVVGFISAVDYIHPDKPRELWINEVAVAPSHQGRGIGKRLLAAMLDLA